MLRAASLLIWGAIISLVMAQKLEFTMSVSPPPQPGSTFEITWAPAQGGRVEILLNNFLTGNIITTSSTIARVEDTGRYVWNVPETLCGRHSVSLSYQFRRIAAYSSIWEGPPCGNQDPTTVRETTACIPTSTSGANSAFKIPDINSYPYRQGKKSWISWVPPQNMNTITLVAEQEKGQRKTTIAENIPNTGSYEWTPGPPFDVVQDLATGFDQPDPYRFVLSDPESSKSSSFLVVGEAYPNIFVNRSSWNTPTIGQPTTFLWSASNEETITLQLVFGAGALPGPDNTIVIADKVPNSGSFTWTPSDSFRPGQYILRSLSGTTGRAGLGLESIVVGRVAPAACSASSSSRSISSSSTTTRISASETSGILSRVQQDLGTTCPSQLRTWYITRTSSSTRVIFPTAGCSSIAAVSATPEPNPSHSCFPNFESFVQDATSTICCPSKWGTTTIDELWCFTSLNDAQPIGGVFMREVEAYTMNENQRTTSVGGGGGGGGLDGTTTADILARATTEPPKVLSLRRSIFVKAVVVAQQSFNESREGSERGENGTNDANNKSDGVKSQASGFSLIFSSIVGICTGILMILL